MAQRSNQQKDANRRAYRESISRELTTITIEPRRVGRPESYTPELGLLVCDKMVEHGNLTAACRNCEELPDRVTVYAWAARHPEFGDAFMRAWERLGLRWADDIVAIADDEDIDPNSRRVKIDARKWVLSKLAAKRFGDKLQVAGDPENPIQVLHRTVPDDTLRSLSPAELDALQALAEARIAAIEADYQEVPSDQ